MNKILKIVLFLYILSLPLQELPFAIIAGIGTLSSFFGLLFVLLFCASNYIRSNSLVKSFSYYFPVILISIYFLFYDILFAESIPQVIFQFINNVLLSTILTVFLVRNRELWEVAMKYFVIVLLFGLFGLFGISYFGELKDGRFFLFQMNPNDAGEYVNLAFLISLELTRRRVIASLYSGIILTVFTVIVVLTASIGGLITLLIFIVLYFKNYPKWIFIAFLLFLFVNFSNITGDLTLLDRINNDTITGTYGGRSEIWDVVKLSIEGNELFGMGISLSDHIMLSNFGVARSAHNLYFQLLLNGGVICVALMVFYLYRLVKGALRAVKKSKDFFLIGLLVLLFVGFFKSGSFYGDKLSWLLMSYIFSQIIVFKRINYVFFPGEINRIQNAQ